MEEKKITKCLTCGGDLAPDDKGIPTCIYCGRQYKDAAGSFSAELQEIVNRRQLREFIQAEELCNELIKKQPESSEAYWQALLASFGVVYVQDENKSKPTFFSFQYSARDAIKSNSNYLNAVKYAKTEEERQYYEKHADELDVLLKEFFNLVAKEDSYDVFISFKRTTTAIVNGKEKTIDTDDYLKAKEIYEYLNKKYKVFFSPVSIGKDTGLSGEKYEPRILKALQTSQAMVLLGSCTEYLESQWVQNEWKRYRYFIEKGKKHKGSLIMGYDRHMYVPLALKDIQLSSFDWYKANYLKEVERLLEPIVKSTKGFRSKLTQKKAATEFFESDEGAFNSGYNADRITFNADGRKVDIKIPPNEQRDMQTAENARDHSQFRDAIIKYDAILKLNPENSKAYWYKFCCKIKAHRNEDVAKCISNAKEEYYVDVDNAVSKASDEKDYWVVIDTLISCYSYTATKWKHLELLSTHLIKYIDEKRSKNALNLLETQYKRYVDSGDTETAELVFATSRKLFFDANLQFNINYMREYAVYLFTHRKYELARKYFEELASARKDAEVYLYLLKCRVRTQNIETAKFALKINSEDDPSTKKPSELDLDEIIERIMLCDPSYEVRRSIQEMVMYQIGYNRRKAGDFIVTIASCIKNTGKTLEKCPVCGGELEDAEDDGVLYAKCKDCGEKFEKPENRLIAFLLAVANRYIQVKDFKNAKVYYTEALNVNANCFDAHWGLLKCRLKAFDDYDLIKNRKSLQTYEEYNNAQNCSNNDEYEACISVYNEQQNKRKPVNRVRVNRNVYLSMTKRSRALKKVAVIGCAAVLVAFGVYSYIDISRPISYTYKDEGYIVKNTGLYFNLGNKDIVLDSYKDLPVYAIGDGAFKNAKLETVVLGDSLEKIGNGAFSGNANLTSVTVHSKDIAVGDYAFKDCESLETFVYEKSTARAAQFRISLGEGAFENCANLTSLDLGNCTAIGGKAFSGCTQLKEITIDAANVSAMSAKAFEGVSSSLKVKIPSVSEDVIKAFAAKFKSVTVESYTRDKLEECIYFIGKLSAVTSDSREDIEKAKRLYSALSASDKGKVHNYYLLENASKVYDAAVLIDAIGTVTMESEAAIIAAQTAYDALSDTQKAMVGNSAKLKDSAAAYEIMVAIEALGDVTLGSKDAIAAIETAYSEVSANAKAAVSNYDKFLAAKSRLKVLTVEDAIAKIGTVTLKSESAISTAEKAYGQLDETERASVTNYEALTTARKRFNAIRVEDKINRIGAVTKGSLDKITAAEEAYDALTDDEKALVTNYSEIAAAKEYFVYLQQFNFAKRSDNSYSVSAANADLKGRVVIPASYGGVRVKGVSSFKNCAHMTGISIPESIAEIYDNAFEGCYRLAEVNNNSSVSLQIDGALRTYIGDGASKLTESDGFVLFDGNVLVDYLGEANVLEIPAAVKRINRYALYNCDKLCSVTVGSGVNQIDDNAFRGCYRLAEVYNKSALNIVKASTDNGCIALYARNVYKTAGGSKLTTDTDGFVLYDGTTLVGYVGRSAEITVPAAVTTIASKAFMNCDVTKVTVPDTVTKIESGAFAGCGKLKSITLPFVGSSAKTASDTNQYPLGYIFGTDRYDGGIATEQFFYDSDASRSSAKTYYIPRSLKSVTLTGGNLLYGAFYNCANVALITLPENLTTIESYAFYNCGLLTVTLPQSLTQIKTNAFNNCNSLIEVCNKSSLTIVKESSSNGYVAYYAKNVCSTESACKLKIDDKGFVIYDGALTAYLGTETELALPSSVTQISARAFEKCGAITSVVVPSSVTKIERGAFFGCGKLESITLPFVGESAKTASEKYQYPLGYIFGTEEYSGGVATTQNYYGSSAGSSTSNTFYIPRTLKSVTITGGNILFGAFYNCNMLTDITLPSDAVSIGMSAFCNCSALTNITLPANLTSMGEYAFYECGSLAGITIPDGVVEIKNSTFYNCIGLKEVKLPARLAIIRSEAFAYCSALTNIELPATLESIESSAFYGCRSLIEVHNLSQLNISTGSSNNGYVAYYAKNVYSTGAGKLITDEEGFVIFDGTLLGYEGDAYEITLPLSVTAIDSTAFATANELTSIVVPSSVTQIGEGAFAGCAQLESITLPFVGGSVKTANDTYQYPFGYIFGTSSSFNVFGASQRYYASNLTNETTTTYYLPQTLRSVTITGGNILYGAFDNCAILTDITLPANITSIGANAFYGCSALEEVKLPANITSIGANAFSGCSGINKISYAGNLASWCAVEGLGTLMTASEGRTLSVGGQAVTGALTVPDGVSKIASYAFYGCDGVTGVTLPVGLRSIGERAFKNCSRLSSVAFPQSEGDVAQPQYSIEAGSFALSGKEYHSTNKDNGSSSTLTFTAQNALSVTIKYRVSSESKYDTFTIKLGSTQIDQISGEVSGTKTINMSAGDQLTFTYSKDNSKNEGNDCGYVTFVFDRGLVVANEAFAGCAALTGVNVPQFVTSIGSGAFSACANLESITLPFVGESAKTASETNQYPLGYIFGEDEYSGGASTFQYYYGSSTSSTTSTTYYIPEKLKNVTVTGGRIVHGAFYNCTNLKSVTLSNGVNSISQSAFFKCTGLKSIVVPSSVTKIGVAAFNSCENLESITLPFVGESAKTASDTYQYPLGFIFGESSYFGSVGTTQYFYGSSTSSTTGYTYYLPLTLKSVTVTGGNILYGAFYNCANLTSVAVPLGITEIGDGAFYNCSSLTAFNMPSAVTIIGANAFYGCAGLKEIRLPATVETVGDGAYEGCTGVESVRFAGDVASWCAVSGTVNVMNCGKESRKLYIGGTEIAGSLVIPEGVKAIGGSAFCNLRALHSVTLPQGLNSIGTFAFLGCLQLAEVRNNSSLNIAVGGADHGYVAYYAQRVLSGEHESAVEKDENGFVIYNGTTLIGYEGGETSVTVPDGITKISKNAFINAANVLSVTVPSTVTEIEKGAFYGCGNLVSITLPFVGASVKTASETYQYPLGFIFGEDSYSGGVGTAQSFYGSSTGSITSATYFIPRTLKSVTVTGGNILRGAFYNCSNLSIVTLPENLTSISANAFYNCSNLLCITIPKNVTSIGTDAFKNCNRLIEVYNKSSLSMSTGYNGYGYVAYYAKNVYKVENGNKLTVDADGFVIYESRLIGYVGDKTEITVPAAVTEIDAKAFNNCYNLTSVVVSETVVKINAGAFYGCGNLVSLTLPFVGESVKTAGATYQYPFGFIFGGEIYSGGVATTQYYYGSSTSSTTSPVFYVPEKLKNVTVTGGNILYGAFYNCINVASITLPDALTAIESHAFRGCTSLVGMEIPSSVAYIGAGAFYNCNKLQSVTFKNRLGWFVNSSASATSGTSTDVSGAKTNAKNLTDTYCDYYWKRK